MAVSLKDFLTENGIINICGPIDAQMAQEIIFQLQYLDYKYPNQEITVYINSPGGSVDAGLAIYDTINNIKADVRTIAVGQAASMGALLLSSGTYGKRCALPNSTILIHQPLQTSSGTLQATDVILSAKYLERLRDRLNNILSLNTGKTPEQIASDTERDNQMTAEEARDYGLIDEVITTTPKAARR